MKNLLITTKHRGVWFAQAEESQDLTPKTLTGLKNCMMAIRWGTKKGLHELCDTGPTEKSKISAVADIEVLHDVTGVFKVSSEATKIWLK